MDLKTTNVYDGHNLRFEAAFQYFVKFSRVNSIFLNAGVEKYLQGDGLISNSV
jgi:hypothetical protein